MSVKAPKEILREGIEEFLEEVKRRARINRTWDLGLTSAGIVLTLAITLVGLSDEIPGKKFWTGGLGAVLVAIQSVSSTFPVKQRSGGYRMLEAQLVNLEFDLMYEAYTGNELEESEAKVLFEKLYELRTEAAKLEGVAGLSRVFQTKKEMASILNPSPQPLKPSQPPVQGNGN